MYTVKLRNYRAAYQGVQGCCQPVTGLWSSLTRGADIRDPGWGWICKLWVPAVLNMRLGYWAQRLLHTTALIFLIGPLWVTVHYINHSENWFLSKWFLNFFAYTFRNCQITHMATGFSYIICIIPIFRQPRQNNTNSSFVALSRELTWVNVLQLASASRHFLD